MLNRILVVNKEKGYTSRDVVNKLVHILHTKKIGHTGTLDPIASGVLVCLVGKYTKLVPLITNLEKEYIATIKLGIKTDTLDITGNIMEEADIRELCRDEILNTFKKLTGKNMQTIPIYSAVSVKGKRLYEYARANDYIELPQREIEIKEIELIAYDNNYIKFRTIVSKGTYIRSLIQDICSSLGVIGTMSDLVRTKQGRFIIDNSYTLKEIDAGNYKSLELEEIIDLQKIKLSNELLKKVLNGNKIEANLEGYILFTKDNQDIALYYFENNIGKLKILF